MLILLFAVELRLLPAGGRGPVVSMLGMPTAAFSLDGLRHLLLPALTLALYKSALVDPDRAGRHARGDAAGLHPLRPRQGAVAPAHHLRARAQEHHDPGRDGSRPRARLDDRIRRRDRDGVRLSGHGQAPDRFDQPPRPSGHRRLPDDDGRDLRGHQPHRRPALRGDRSARAACRKRRADRWPNVRADDRDRAGDPGAPARHGLERSRREPAAPAYRRVPREPRRRRSALRCSSRSRCSRSSPLPSRRRTPTTCRSSTSWTTC